MDNRTRATSGPVTRTEQVAYQRQRHQDPGGTQRPGTYETAQGLFGQVMGLVALTVGLTAFGAYLGRHLEGGIGILFFVAAFACVVGLNRAADRGDQPMAIGWLCGLGLSMGLAVAPVLADYASAQPSALWQAAGATAAFVACLGAYGYATRRDLSSWNRTLSWALLALIAFGIVTLFASIPNANVIYSVLGLAIFGGFTVVDFNRLRGAGIESSVSIAASIFLDIFNVFLLLLNLFSGGRE